MRALATGAVLAAIVGIAVAVDPAAAISPEWSRRGYLLALGLVAAAALLWSRDRFQVPRWAIALLLADLLVHTISASLALDPQSAWLGGPDRGLGVLDAASWSLIALLLAQRGAMIDGSVALIARTGVITTLALAGIALLQAYADWCTAPAGAALARPDATLGNASFLASVLAMSLPVLVVARANRILLLVCALPIAAVLLLTQGRGALLAGLLGAICAWLLSGNPTRPRLVTMALLLLGSVLALFALGSQIERSDSLNIRLGLYRAAMEAQTSPVPLVDIGGLTDPVHRWRQWIGYGPDNIEPVLTRHRDAELNRFESQGWDKLADRTHNRLLDRWIELGAPGVLLGLMLGCVPLVVAIRRWRNSEYQQTGQASTIGLAQQRTRYQAAAFGCWVVFGIDGLFGVPNAMLDLLAALAFGVLISPWSPATTRSDQSQTTNVERWRVWLAHLSGAAMVFALAATIGWLRHHELPPSPSQSTTSGTLAGPRYSALPSLLALERLHRDQADLRFSQIDQAQLLGAAEHAARAAPSLPRAWHLLGWVRQHSGDEPGARQAYLQALSLLEQAQGHAPADWKTAAEKIRAADALQAADLVGARELLGSAQADFEAIADAHRDAAWYRSYAYLRARQGNVDAAIAAYQQALLLVPSDQASRRNLQILREHQEAAREWPSTTNPR